MNSKYSRLINRKEQFAPSEDDFYLEIQRHNDNGEKLFEKFLIDASSKLNIPIIATQEVFYLEKDMHEAHDAYLCIGEKTSSVLNIIKWKKIFIFNPGEEEFLLYKI